MKFLIGMLAKVYILVLFVFMMEILLQVATLEILLDQEIKMAESVGCFDEARIYNQLNKHKTLQNQNVTKVEVKPDFSEYAKQLGEPMSIAIYYNLRSSIVSHKPFKVRVERQGVNTGYYGEGYKKVR